MDLSGGNVEEWIEHQRASLRNKYASKLKGSNKAEAKRRATMEKRDTPGSASLINYQDDSTFYAPVTIGTPGQSVNLVLDTGSSDMWTVQGKENWSPSASSTFQNSTTAFQISYGSGDVTGTLASDKVVLADHTAESQTFALATSVSNGLLGNAVEGIMGLGFQSLSTSKSKPFWQNAGADQFSFYLKSDGETSSSEQAPGGTFTLGGTNSSFYTGDINWSTVIDEAYWLITLGGITINGQTVDLKGTSKVAVDTGTTLIGAPDSVVEQFYSQIPNSQKTSSGYYTFPCSTTDLNATMHFGNQEYTLGVQQLIAGTVDTRGQDCLGSFFSIGSDSSDEMQYILGDAFLMNVYSVFDNSGDKAQVGFASLASGLGGGTSSTTVNQVIAASGALSQHAPFAFVLLATTAAATMALLF